MEKKASLAENKPSSASSPATLPRTTTPAVLPRTTRPPVIMSVTKAEINHYWRMKRIIEEDHLLAAEKAAARIRAKVLKEEDYRRFEESLKEMLDGTGEREKEEKMLDGTGECKEEEKILDGTDECKKEEKKEVAAASINDNKEIRIGIKDWWTKSRYAYLNQPAIKSMGENPVRKRPTSTYTPQLLFCNFSPAAQLYTTSFGVSG